MIDDQLHRTAYPILDLFSCAHPSLLIHLASLLSSIDSLYSLSHISPVYLAHYFISHQSPRFRINRSSPYSPNLISPAGTSTYQTKSRSCHSSTSSVILPPSHPSEIIDHVPSVRPSSFLPSCQNVQKACRAHQSLCQRDQDVCRFRQS